MKKTQHILLQALFVAFSFLVVLGVLEGCTTYRRKYTNICDFPDSRWICTSRDISIVVDSNKENRAIYKKDDENIYMWVSIDSLGGTVALIVITEREYYGEIEGIVVGDQQVFGGHFKCDEEKFIAVSEEDHNADFWEIEEDTVFVLEFDCVE